MKGEYSNMCMAHAIQLVNFTMNEELPLCKILSAHLMRVMGEI